MRMRAIAYATLPAAAAALLACRSSARFDVGPVPAGVLVDTRIQYYEVTASSLAELRDAMRRQGPRWEGRAYQAVTQSHFRWTYQFESRPGACSIRRPRVQVQTVVIFPRWTPSAEPDSALMEWWRQLNAGLVEHERGHAQISVRSAGDIARAIDGLSSTRCDALDSRANASAQNEVRASQRRQAEYDVSTRHGATQIQQAGRLRAP